MLLAAGCDPEHLDEVARLLGRENVADSHFGRYEQVSVAIERVMARHA
jgi:hypothetical protein